MFTASDGTKIDIKADFCEKQKALLVVWPCMTGSTAMYRLPVQDFNSAGISTVQFNPRGHGSSAGQFDLDLCISDLNEYIASLDAPQTPLWLMGHSGGAFCVLKYSTKYKPAHRHILVSPVLDSRGSYVHLYDNGNFMEANILISTQTKDREFMLSILKDSRWMQRDVWESEKYREKIDSISDGPLVGTLMQRLFLEGYNAHHELELHGASTSIILPVNDNWYPMDLTNSLAHKSGITVETINEAGDHYFTGAWKFVWKRVLQMME